MKHSIPYGRQYIDDADLNAVAEVLKGDYLTTGPYVKGFEEKFAGQVGARYAVAVSNGTAALHLACMAAKIGSGDEVLTSPMTFTASANCALYVGARPMFADIDPQTLNIDPREIRKKITVRTRAIIPVHYTGLPCAMDEIQSIAEEHKLVVIEDACHALGAQFKDTKIGDCRYSNMTVFSFHPVKHITTGEGGMITTNSRINYERLLSLRSHGIVRDEERLENDSDGNWYYEMQMLGYNYRLTDIQSALGISQLTKLDRLVERRREIATIYNEEFAPLPLELPMETDDARSSYHLYVVRVKDGAQLSRKQLYDSLRNRGIFCQVHYIPVHTSPYYRQQFGYDWGDFPIAEDHYHRALSIPMFPGMTDQDVKTVVTTITEVLK
jgi:perosamine synthetase